MAEATIKAKLVLVGGGGVGTGMGLLNPRNQAGEKRDKEGHEVLTKWVRPAMRGLLTKILGGRALADLGMGIGKSAGGILARQLPRALLPIMIGLIPILVGGVLNAVLGGKPIGTGLIGFEDVKKGLDWVINWIRGGAGGGAPSGAGGGVGGGVGAGVPTGGVGAPPAQGPLEILETQFPGFKEAQLKLVQEGRLTFENLANVLGTTADVLIEAMNNAFNASVGMASAASTAFNIGASSASNFENRLKSLQQTAAAVSRFQFMPGRSGTIISGQFERAGEFSDQEVGRKRARTSSDLRGVLAWEHFTKGGIDIYGNPIPANQRFRRFRRSSSSRSISRYSGTSRNSVVNGGRTVVNNSTVRR
jgi:hypothetical protein